MTYDEADLITVVGKVAECLRKYRPERLVGFVIDTDLKERGDTQSTGKSLLASPALYAWR